MATRPQCICTYPGCGKLVLGSARCEKHPYPERKWAQRGEVEARIHNEHWTRLRKMVLARCPVCAGCGRKPSTQVDHKVARQDGGTDEFENLQGLCGSCHAAKTARESAARRRRRALNFPVYR